MTDKKDKALKLALEYITQSGFQTGINEVITAIKEAMTEQPAQRCPLCNYQHGHAIGCENNPVDIALAKMAEQPAQQQEPPAGCVVVSRAVLKTLGIDDAVIDTIARPAPQPAQQQEPVAWASMLPNEAIGVVTWSKDTAKAWASKGHIIKELSFTSPPAQRKPLTDEEISRIWMLNGGGLAANRYHDFARAIEAAHGITGEQK